MGKMKEYKTILCEDGTVETLRYKSYIATMYADKEVEFLFDDEVDGYCYVESKEEFRRLFIAWAKGEYQPSVNF